MRTYQVYFTPLTKVLFVKANNDKLDIVIKKDYLDILKKERL